MSSSTDAYRSCRLSEFEIWCQFLNARFGTVWVPLRLGRFTTKWSERVEELGLGVIMIACGEGLFSTGDSRTGRLDIATTPEVACLPGRLWFSSLGGPKTHGESARAGSYRPRLLHISNSATVGGLVGSLYSMRAVTLFKQPHPI